MEKKTWDPSWSIGRRFRQDPVSSSGWWLGHPSEKYEFVSWDDDIPNIWENEKWQPNHQPVIFCCVVISIYQSHIQCQLSSPVTWWGINSPTMPKEIVTQLSDYPTKSHTFALRFVFRDPA